MSEQDNVAVVRKAYADFGRGDIAAVLNALSDDVEWTLPEVEGIELGGTFRGKAGVTKFFQMLAAQQDSLEFEPQEFIAQGDRVVVLGHYRWLIKSTGREVASSWAHVFTVRDGKATRFLEFFDTAAAQRAYQRAAGA